MNLSTLSKLSFSISLVFCLFAAAVQAKEFRAEPEPGTGLRSGQNLSTGSRHMIAAANPHAVRAGLSILRQGGSAVDAAIATQLVLNLVEPQSSGIGGGAFILHWQAREGKLESYDGRETAPLSAKTQRFLTKKGSPMPFREAVFSGLGIGAPGTLKVLELAYKRQGKLPWETLFQPAIQLAETGFKVSARLNTLLRRYSPDAFGPVARRYFFARNDAPRPIGYRLKNPEFADILKLIARNGVDYFYRGPFAGHIAGIVKNAPNHGGDLSAGDLARYQAIMRPPVCSVYRGYRICGMGPPSSGALTVNQVLRLIEPFDLGREALNARALHIIAEAEKLAYADRNRYMADADFIDVPKGLLDEAYIGARRQLIDPEKTMGKAQPGQPPVKKGKFGQDATIENNGTSHISIIDGDGNALSMTTSIEAAFGSRIMVSGFLLNNELTDFSFRPVDEKGHPIANRVEPGKRPRSSMAPTLVFAPDGRISMVVGSPGGSRIILYLLKAIIAHIDWGLNAREIANLPNFGSRNGPLEIEKGSVLENRIKQLKAYGHNVKVTPMTSGLHIIIVNEKTLTGFADPRREGLALAD